MGRMRRPVALLLVLAAACSEDPPPRIVSSSVLLDTPDAHGPYRIVSVVEDERRVVTGTVFFTTDGSPIVDTSTAAQVPMASDDGTTWIAELPGLPLGTLVTWMVAADDASDHRTTDPAQRPGGYRFVVGNVPSRPDLLTLWPARGPTSGGTEVLIVGRDLREGITARFGAAAAETLELLSRTQARVKTPRGPVGFVDVRVENRDGGAGVKLGGFEYFPAPEIDAVIPSSGPVAGGTFVRIAGKRFAEGASFLFAGDPCTRVTIVSNTEATCFTPAHAAGSVDVSIVHPLLGMGSKPDAFLYIPPPEVLAIDPARGTDLGGTRVRVTGRSFDRGARLLFDTVPATEVTVVSPQRIDATTPAHPAGLADVRVINSDAQEGRLADGFFFFGPPEIDRVEPPYGASEGGATVRVIGRNFVEDTDVTLELGATLVRATCTFLSDTRLSCVMPAAAPDSYDVTVTNPDQRSDTLAAGFTYFQITAVTPNEGPESGNNEVWITGVHLPPGTSIFFGGTLAGCFRVSETRIDCVAPRGPGDTFVDVDALPPDAGQVPSTLIDGYYYIPAPEVLSTMPDFGPLRGGQTITIVGRDFEPGATVTLNGNTCTDVVFVSSTELRCVVPPGVPGDADVRVENPDGQAGHRSAYEYVPITFTPKWALVDGFANMDLVGAGFAPNAAVTIGGQAALDVVFLSPQHMRARAPSAAHTGGATVIVANPGETAEISPTSLSYRVYRNRSTPDMAGSGEASDVMIVDLDNDGDNDLVYVNGSNDQPSDQQTLENLGGGTSWLSRFMGSVQVSNEGNHCDFDRDGDEDLVWGTSSGPIRVFRNNGGFNFSALSLPTQPGESFEASFHDVTGDGLCDLINIAISQPDTVLRNDNGTFTVIQNALPDDVGFVHDHKLDTADFDGDGDNDMVVVVDDVNFPSMTQRHRIYRNDGSGVFTEDMRNRALMESIHGDIYDVRVGDVDLDGDVDIVMPAFNQAPVLLLNDGHGVFTRDLTRISTDSFGASALLLEDFEGDGDLDLYLVDLDGPIGGSSALFLNDGRGFFFRALVGEPQSPPGSYRAAAGDLNGDGATDIVFGVVFSPNRMDWAEE